MAELTTQRLNLFYWVDRLGRSQRIGLLCAAILLAVLWGGAVGIYGPWQQNRSRLLEQSRQEQERTQLLSTIALQRGKLHEQQKRLLLTGGAFGLTQEISRLGSQAGIQIESVTPEPEQLFGPYSQSQIHLVASATSQQLLQFLRLLENQASLLRVDQLEVGTPPATAPAGIERGPLPFQESSAQRVGLWISAFLRRESAT